MASGPGDAWVGAKIALTSQADGQPLAFAVRAMAKLPTGSTKDGASTGKADPRSTRSQADARVYSRSRDSAA